MSKCNKCGKMKLGELQSICKYCGYSDGDDRWFSNQDETISLSQTLG
ncbi:hypothetical protein KY309_00400 [Candidatus Woesearchaeota archaeon]|nr:hypothetical protein [Candidatus Woesearchaeota archaeon]MBW3016053.1 hypothetical protein [Candidatus Woesearchaeota archaeon]